MLSLCLIFIPASCCMSGNQEFLNHAATAQAAEREKFMG
jgi:hypothetical protein